MPPSHKSYENLDVEPILKDGSLQISPNNKYICVASTEYIIIVQVNTDMLKVPVPNFFHTSRNIDINKTHGTQLVSKFIPVKKIVRELGMEDTNKIVCDVKVCCDELFTNSCDMKKLRWSPCAFKTDHSLLGSLNSLGFLEIIHCHGSKYSRLFQINNLWYKHCMKNYFKKYPFPKLPTKLKAVLMNCCSLLWIESFAWIPMSNSESGLILVCYHKRGILTLWKIQQKISDPLETSQDKSFVNTTIEEPSLGTPTKSKKKNAKKEEPSEVPDMFNHECSLVKVVTDYCDHPFSRENLIINEFELKPGDRVLNIEYIKLNETQHTVAISKGNGTLLLWELDLRKDTLTHESSLYSDSVTINTSKFSPDQTLDSSMNTEEKSNVDETEKDNTQNTGKELDEKMDVESEENSITEPPQKKTKLSQHDMNNSDEKYYDSDTEMKQPETNDSEAFIPRCHNVFDKTDNMFIANLVVTYTNDRVIIVFNKLSILFCVVLNKNGEVLDKFHHRIKTRTIVAIAKFTKTNYLVGTFENKLLTVHINEINNLESHKLNNNPDKSYVNPSNSDDLIIVKRSIDMTNSTHLLNGIINSSNSYLTVLSFKINVRYETNFLSRRPCFLSLITLHSETSLLSGHLPCSSPHKQVDFIKCLSLKQLNIVKLSTICATIRDARLKYFLLKIFKPKDTEPTIENQLDMMLAQLEKTIYLKYIKRCMEQGIFSTNSGVLVLFREWVINNFPGDGYIKLKASFPNDLYQELCFLCDRPMQVKSMRYGLCSAGHQVLRCSLSLAQCMESYVRCCYCLAYVCTKFTEDPSATCVFCDAKISQVR